MEIQLVTGDLLNQQDCDGIVNSANRELLPGAGVSGAIHRAGPIKLTQAVVSPGYALPNRWIIHVAAPHYFQDALPHDALARAIRAVLDQARIQGIYRIAMPGLSIGIYRFPVEEAAMVTAQTLTAEAHRTRPSLIRLVFLDADITTHYEEA
ncbi:MAG: hypothetical protein RL585_2745, partial [Pseudomonadota bacterium]